MSEFITKVVIAADNQTAPALNAATKGVENYAKAATAAQAQVRGASRQSRAAFQQLGYQVQDISVQLQAGQSPFIVLAQQGSQVASIFGPGGAVIGALIAIGGAIAGSLLPALFKASATFEDMQSKAKELGLDIKTIAPITTTKKIEELRKKIEENNAAMEKQGEVIRENLIKAQQKSGGQMARNNDIQGRYTANVEEARQKIEELTLANLGLGDQIKTIQEETEKATTPIDNWREALEKSIATVGMTNEQLKIYEAVQQGATQADLERLHTLLMLERELAEMTEAEKEAARKDDERKKQAEERARKEKEQLAALRRTQRAYNELYATLRGGRDDWANYDSTVTAINDLNVDATKKAELMTAAFEKLQPKIEEVTKKVKSDDWEEAKTALQSYSETAQDLFSLLDNAGVSAMNRLETEMSNLIAGTGSVKDAFRSMASSIVSDLIKIQVQKSITGPLAGLLGSALSNFGTAMTYGTNVGSEQTRMLAAQDFEGGGYTGSGVRSGGLDGKGGFMAMVHPNETVIDHEKGGGSGVVVNQTINVTTGVQQTVRTEIASLMPQIAAASKQAVLEARKRGGSFASTFGAS